MSTLSELELRLYIPPQSQTSLSNAVNQLPGHLIHLQAKYFDTPERDLAKRSIAIRIRREDQQWVQTLKAPGSHAIEQLELNHPLNTPELDLELYKNQPIYDLLKPLQATLQIRFETDVQRRIAYLQTHTGLVELAHDTGFIRAGAHQTSISEVEFELKEGDISAVLDSGLQWLTQHQLALEFRSKAERGDRLARSCSHSQEVTTRVSKGTSDTRTPSHTPPHKQALQIIEQLARSSLQQIQSDDPKALYPHTPEIEQQLIRLQTLLANTKDLSAVTNQSDQALIERVLKQLEQLKESDTHQTNTADTHSTHNMQSLVVSTEFQGWMLSLFARLLTQHAGSNLS